MSYLLQLRTFVEVYRAGSLSKAAQNLGLSQPAVSAHIQALETAVGKALFVRQARGVSPTPTAEDLALQSAAHLDALESKLASVRSRSQQLSGTLTLAGPSEYLTAVAGPMLANVLQGGQIDLVVLPGARERIYQALQSGEADLAISGSTPDPQLYDAQVLDGERLLLVMNRLTGSQSALAQPDAALLAAYPLVAYDVELSLVRQYFQAVFNDSCRSKVVALCPDLRLLASLVQAGVGYTVLPDYLCRGALARGELLQCGPAGPENLLYLVWRKGALKQPRLAYCRDLLLAFANLNRLTQR